MAMMRDNRSGKINEILNAIKVIKLFNLEPFQYKKIVNQRARELFFINKANILGAEQTTLTDSIPFAMICISYALMWGLKRFNFETVFTLNFLYNQMRGTFGFVPIFFFSMTDAKISYKRITTFLKLPEADRDIIEHKDDTDDAIVISGNHHYVYGLEDDLQIRPELDS